MTDLIVTSPTPLTLEDALKSDSVKINPPTLEEWLGLMEKTPKGIDPVLSDFLRGNPKFFDAVGYEDEVITPRKLNLLSQTLREANNTFTHVEKGKVWFMAPVVAECIVGKEMTEALITFAQERGLNVQRGTSHSLQATNPSPDELGPKR